MARAVGKLLLATVFAALLVNCGESTAHQLYVAQKWKEIHDQFYKNLKERSGVRSRHLLDYTIDRMDNEQHRSLFRLDRRQFKKVLRSIRDFPELQVAKFATSEALSARDKLYICLYHLATGASFHVVAEFFGVSPPSVMRAVYTCTGEAVQDNVDVHFHQA